jgi:hypothetical protein
MEPDKIMHIKAGVLIAMFAAAVSVACVAAGLAPASAVPLAVALSGIVGGLVKEGADWLENRAHPGTHGVEVLDAVATAAPALIAAVVIQNWAVFR